MLSLSTPPTLTRVFEFGKLGPDSKIQTHMDVLQIIKPKIKPLKATYETLTFKHKLVILLILISFANFIIPHETYAAQAAKPSSLVFILGDYTDYLDELNSQARQGYYEQQLRSQLTKKQELIKQVKAYLSAYNSPLVDAVPTLITLKNWKKIVALSNAESSLCRKYPVGTANCWGVGGSDLWDFGTNLTQGVIAMNHFLENYPRRSAVKYSQMTFDQMNGLYKQPAKEHWVVNNEVIYDDLIKLENGI